MSHVPQILVWLADKRKVERRQQTEYEVLVRARTESGDSVAQGWFPSVEAARKAFGCSETGEPPSPAMVASFREHYYGDYEVLWLGDHEYSLLWWRAEFFPRKRLTLRWVEKVAFVRYVEFRDQHGAIVAHVVQTTEHPPFFYSTLGETSPRNGDTFSKAYNTFAAAMQAAIDALSPP